MRIKLKVKNFFDIIRNSRFADIYITLILSFLLLINLIGFAYIKSSLFNIVANLIIFYFVILINSEEQQGNNKMWFIFTRNIYYLLIILFVYSQFQILIKAFRTIDYDNLLIKLDLYLLGENAGDYFVKYSSPILTEYLQIAYSLFYFLPVIVGWEIWKRQEENLDLFARNIIFAYFFSYFLYLILPAIGPRFTIYNFTKLSEDLPGLYLTKFLRWAINVGGGITNDHLNPTYLVNRDCMPSGHTMITLVTIYYSFKLKTKVKSIILILGLSVIFATIYMRYHYFVDIIAGFVFGFISIWLEPYFNKIIRRIKIKSSSLKQI